MSRDTEPLEQAAGPTSGEEPASEPTPPLLEVDGVRLVAGTPRGDRTVVDSVSFTIRPGETLAVVGESGSGKSMTAKAITGLLPKGVRIEGDIRFNGRSLTTLSERQLAKLRGRGIGLVFQDPFTMLNPMLTIADQLLEPVKDARGRRLRGSAAHAEAVRRLAEVGIRDESVADKYPFQLSGGMRQRVGLAASLASDPELLIADEPATALDVTTQAEILALLDSIRRQRGMALILITHDLRIAFSACERVAVLYAGTLLETGGAREIETSPGHPYTQGLLLSEPDPHHRLARLESIPGSVPRPDEVAHQCSFAPRCAFATDRCRTTKPALEPLGDSRMSACLRIDEIGSEMANARKRMLVVLPERDTHAQVSPLLEVHDVRKEFVNRRGGLTVAIKNASIEVGSGESVGLVGESGSGKTTLSRCIVGLETPTSGSIEFRGESTAKRRAQIVFQDPYSSLNPKLTVGACLREAVRLQDRSANIDRAVTELLDLVGLPTTYRDRRPARLSGGERQRVAIARALALRPDLLVCDEPVSALDVSVQAQILELLRDVREATGIAYLVVTHDLAVVRQIVDRVYVMQGGSIIEAGPVAQVLDSPQQPYTQRLVDAVPSLHAPESGHQ
jgi:peptide/nickel transport system ATP-binding protein